MENAAWKLLDITDERQFKWGTYFINIHVKLQRRAHFATFTIVTPLLMLAFLNVGVFLVPSGSGEKGTFAITIFLAYGIFITIVSDTLPHNSLQTSYFVVFILSLLSVSALSVFYAVLQAKLLSFFGNKECKIRCYCCDGSRVNRVEPFRHDNAGNMDQDHREDATKEGQNLKDVYTWGVLFNKIDGIMCIVFFLIVASATAIFFCVMLNHIVNGRA